jgi:hypothetical protein
MDRRGQDCRTDHATGSAQVASFTVDINDAIELRGVIRGTAARMAAEADPLMMMGEAERILAEIDTLHLRRRTA